MKKIYENMLSGKKVIMSDQDVQDLLTLANDFCLLYSEDTREKVIDIVTKNTTYNDAHRQIIDLLDLCVFAA